MENLDGKQSNSLSLSLLNFLFLNETPAPANSSANSSDSSSHELLVRTRLSFSIILSVFSCISILFFSLTYLTSQVRNRDKHKETKKTALRKLARNEYLVLSYCTALLLSHLAGVGRRLVQLLMRSDSAGKSVGCVTSAAICHFLWLSVLVHSSAVSYKIYAKLTKERSNSVIEKKPSLRAILKNLLLIYLIALVIVLTCVTLQLCANEVYVSKSKADQDSCSLNDPLFEAIFFNLPVSLVFLFNLFLFWRIFRRTHETVQHSESADMHHLFLKLAAIMGLSWLVYVLFGWTGGSVHHQTVKNVAFFLAHSQMDLQGAFVAIGLYSHAAYEKFVKKNVAPAAVAVAVPQLRNQNITVL
nr:G protein-coupled receptor [Proales similis]